MYGETHKIFSCEFFCLPDLARFAKFTVCVYFGIYGIAVYGSSPYDDVETTWPPYNSTNSFSSKITVF